jgi:hypothetical protein
MGHAISFVLVLSAFIALLRSLFVDAIRRARLDLQQAAGLHGFHCGFDN